MSYQEAHEFGEQMWWLRRWCRVPLEAAKSIANWPPFLSDVSDQSARSRRRFTPSVRSLEPRLVLDAKAALTELGLVVLGTEMSETVNLKLDGSGALQLTDQNNDIIPIEGNPAGADAPLDPGAIESRRIFFDLKGGGDILDLDLPSGLDVDVTGGLGDQTSVAFTDVGEVADNDITIAAENIRIKPSPTVSIVDDRVTLTGDVEIGTNENADARTRLDLGVGRFEVDGRFTLGSDVFIVGTQGTLDFSETTLSADDAGFELRVMLGQGENGKLSIAGADPSGGALVDKVIVVSAHEFTIDGPFQIDGDLVVNDIQESIRIDGVVTADSVLLRSQGDIEVLDPIETRDGNIVIASDQGVAIRDDLRVTGPAGSVSIGAAAVELDGSSSNDELKIETSGGFLRFAGPVTVHDQVSIDSGQGDAQRAGFVEFTQSIGADDGIGDRLFIEAKGQGGADGLVRVNAPVGSVAGADVRDLNGLEIDAGQIEINSTSVTNGDIRLDSITTQFMRSPFPDSSLVTRNAGSILINSQLLLPVDDVRIEAADHVELVQGIEGQTGTNNLSVTAGGDALFRGRVKVINDLDVRANGKAIIEGPIRSAGDVLVVAPMIEIRADVDTLRDGNVRLFGQDSVLVTDDATIQVGQGSITVNGGAGSVDTGDAALVSDFGGDAIVVENTSTILFGDLFANSGRLVIGSATTDVTGSVTQSAGRAVQVDRISARTLSEIRLDNVDNQIRELQRIDARKITFNDSLDDLLVREVNSNGNDLTLTTTGTMELFDRSVIAVGAVANLTAGGAILDVERGAFAENIFSGRVVLQSGEAIGQLNNPIDVIATVAIDADTNAVDGDIHLANLPGPILIGQIDAGDGVVTLQADSIDEAFVDSDLDIFARDLTLIANNGIGDRSSIELQAVSNLIAKTDRGDVDLNLSATRDANVEEVSTVSGDIRFEQFNEMFDVTLQSVVATDGSISIGTDGSLLAVFVESSNVSGSDDANGGPTRDITLQTRGAASDVIVTQLAALRSADIKINSADDTLDSRLDDESILIADDLQVTAENQNADGDKAIELTTRIEDLDANVRSAGSLFRGDLIIHEEDSIRLASSDAATDLETVSTVNGQVIVTAPGEIRVVDSNPDNESAAIPVDGAAKDLSADREIDARGPQGRIDLQAGQRIRFDDAVQVGAEKQTTRSLVEFEIIPPADPTPDAADSRIAAETETELRSVVLRKDAAVYLRAGAELGTGEVIFGDDIEINTGPDQGVARAFGPRPLTETEFDMLDPSERFDTAFYDVGSITTNVLEQADVNNATGILTVDIGVPGERGLTINIDWGAPTLRFQQIDGLTADDSYFVTLQEPGDTPDDGLTRLVDTPAPTNDDTGLLKVEHKYTERNILLTRFNDRESETKPIEVRFSMRHHESIVVLGSSIVQGEGEGAPVPLLPEEGNNPQNVPLTISDDLKRVISATDNDNTTIQDENRNLSHEQATTSFLIPSLSIPVAFFPVREVIPEFETPEVFVRSVTVTLATKASLETVESGVTASVTQSEYLRIGVVPPDPNTPADQIAWERLPDDILSGDNLQRLLKGVPEEQIEGLPDGRYEIQYVLEGTTRSIFRFDLRDGVPTSLGDGLDEGVLKLRPVPLDLPSDQSDSDATEQPDGDDASRVSPPLADHTEKLDPDPSPTADGPRHDQTKSAAALIAAAPILRRRLTGRDRSRRRLSAAGRFAGQRTNSQSST